MKRYLNQLLAVFLACLIMYSGGLHFGWAAPSLPKLLDEEADLSLTTEECSLIVSLLSFGAIFGPLAVYFLADRVGRKWTLIVIALPMLTSWLLLGLAKSAIALYVGRFVGGLSIGAVYTILPMYACEISEDRIRGALSVLITIMMNFGMITAYSLGPFVSIQTLSLGCCTPSLIFLGSFLWMPETPYYLIMKEKRVEALASLAWLRRTDDVKDELSRIEASIELQQKSRVSKLDLVKIKSNRKALFFMTGLLTIQQFTGVLTIQAYSTTIFAQSGSGMSSDLSTIIMGLVILLSGVIVFFVVDLTGRRPFLIFSSTFTALSLFCEGAFFHLQALDYDTTSISWVPLAAILVFYLSCSIGLGCLPYTIIGEVFPTDVKASATTILSMYGSGLAAIVGQSYQSVSDKFGIYTVFYGFAMFCTFGVFFVIFFVPETKRRSLQDIQDSLKTGSYCMGLSVKKNLLDSP